MDHSDKSCSAGEIWSIISHDLKSPLGSMRGNLEFLQTDILPMLLEVYEKALAAGIDIPKIRPDRLALYQDTVPGTQHSLERVMQYIARMDRKLCPQYYPIGLRGIAIESCIKHAIAQYRASLTLPTYIFSVENAVIDGDETMIHYILYELLANAQWALAEGNASKPTITIAGMKNGPNYRISIKNNGLKIPDADLPRLFEPYFSTHSAIGLGLSFCQTAMHAMHGTIACTSTDADATEWVLVFNLDQNDLGVRAS